MSEKRTYRQFTAKQKAEIVPAGLCGDRPVRDVCREHEIAETLYQQWREKLLEGGRAALAGRDERQGEKELRRRVAELERALGRKTYELELAGELLREWEQACASPPPVNSSPSEMPRRGARRPDHEAGPLPAPEAEGGARAPRRARSRRHSSRPRGGSRPTATGW